ncbi:C-C motif chemokine 19-like [Gouania willdenowi]|uniref:C-C motif chemokine 19-like n=1 Tax=Gouania willdenowi TaxID=441366 RepID=UPI001054B6FD|nr:C-C motif chemokine 19-like [Gouania willdenowi]
MAVSGDARLCFAILLITCCVTQTLTQVPSDCCLRVKNVKIGAARVADYHQQISGQGCFIDATVLETKHGRKLCVPPGEPWVQKLLKRVDKLKKHQL